MEFLKPTFLFAIVLVSSSVLRCDLAGAPAGNNGTGQPPEMAFRTINDNLIVVRGTIGDRSGLNIILDTGTNPTVVAKELAAEFNLRGDTEPSVTVGGTFEIHSIILPRIDVGGWHVESSKAVIQDLDYLKREFGVRIDAIAGLDLLSTRSCMIDYLKRKIFFGPGTKGRKSVKFETRWPYLTVQLNLNGQKLRVLVDSGTPRLLLYRRRLKARFAAMDAIRVENGPSLLGAGGTVRAGWYRTSRVMLGENGLGPQTVLVIDGDSGFNNAFDGLLGLAQTGFHKVWLDFENGLLSWE
jgi:predicted aspartyl protease